MTREEREHRRATDPSYRDAWQDWKRCAVPKDIVTEIEEIARHRGDRPRTVVWDLIREALRARRGLSPAGVHSQVTA